MNVEIAHHDLGTHVDMMIQLGVEAMAILRYALISLPHQILIVADAPAPKPAETGSCP